MKIEIKGGRLTALSSLTTVSEPPLFAGAARQWAARAIESTSDRMSTIVSRANAAALDICSRTI